LATWDNLLDRRDLDLEFPGRVACDAWKRQNGVTLDLAMAPTYLLASFEGAWKIFAFVGPDELTLAREHGLIGGELRASFLMSLSTYRTLTAQGSS
jgi:hypothetical protein